mmetsp:Transcript_36746/g.68114  ORF Transcript_36746/g.68114 Transcript_36746/m.68114 type:complete len:222 (-) Transcript_36746:196-861(-)
MPVTIVVVVLYSSLRTVSAIVIIVPTASAAAAMHHHATVVVSMIGMDSPSSLPLPQAFPLVPLLALLLPLSLLPPLALRLFLGSLTFVVCLALVGRVRAPVQPVGIGVHVVVVLGRGLRGSPIAVGAASSFVVFVWIVQSDAPFVIIVAVPVACIFVASSILATTVLPVLLAALLVLQIVHDQLGTASAHPPGADLLLLSSLLVHLLVPVLSLARLALLTL